MGTDIYSNENQFLNGSSEKKNLDDESTPTVEFSGMPMGWDPEDLFNDLGKKGGSHESQRLYPNWNNRTPSFDNEPHPPKTIMPTPMPVSPRLRYLSRPSKPEISPTEKVTPTNMAAIFRYARPLAEQADNNWEVQSKRKKFRLRVANTQSLRERCFRLGYQVYRKTGYAEEDPRGILVNQYDAQSDTFIVLVSDEEDRDVATLTLVFDRIGTGLPLDNVYKTEADGLRRKGRRLAEYVRLAIDDSVRGCKEVLVHMFSFGTIYAWQVMKYDDFVITVNPKHAGYYNRVY